MSSQVGLVPVNVGRVEGQLNCDCIGVGEVAAFLLTRKPDPAIKAAQA